MVYRLHIRPSIQTVICAVISLLICTDCPITQTAICTTESVHSAVHYTNDEGYNVVSRDYLLLKPFLNSVLIQSSSGRLSGYDDCSILLDLLDLSPSTDESVTSS